MALNKDGLEPGKPVDFVTLMRVQREQREAAKNAKPEPKKRGRKKVHSAEQSGDESAPESVIPEEA